jgi:hypothetical protein
MNLKRFILILLFLIDITRVQADIIFPARIELKESTPGEFDVLFTLPIINNRKLKAELVLPDVCRELTEHKVSSTYTSYIETWKVGCEPEDLFGQPITIKGLLGTYVEIMLQINMLDGRAYSTTLKPSRSSFVIPQPSSVFKLILHSSYIGMRSIVTRPEIYLLLFVMVFFISPKRKLFTGLIAYFFAHLIGQYMAQELLIKLSVYISSFVIFIIVLLPAFDLVQGKPALRRWFQPVWLLAIILGFLSGGANAIRLSLPGLSYNEQYFVIIGSNLGMAIGLILIYFLIREFKYLLTIFVLRTRPQKAHLILGYMIGISVVGFLLHQSTSLLIIPSVLPELSLEFFILPFIFGIWFWQADIHYHKQSIISCMILMIVGLIIGGSGFKIPFGSLLMYTGILIICSQLIFALKYPPIINLIIAILSAFSYGWTAAQIILENLTLPIANTIGIAGLAICFFFIAYNYLSEKPEDPTLFRVKILAGFSALLILVLRIFEYEILLNREIATNLALGQLTIPVISLILIIGTLLVWPRKRKIHQQLDIEIKKPVKHWGFIIISFLVLPFGHINIANPLFESHAPQGNEARLVLQQVLANTYHAFNLNDEDELYQKLSESVSGDLVANIYLDSRRRLTAGVRQGAEVSVRDVSVASVGDLIEGTNPSEGFTYESKWTVVARVKHLQHIHHRKNLYTGFLTIKVEDNKWKIVDIDLKSEDRVIVQGSSG